MKDLLRDIIYMGAGAAFLTREKAEGIKAELIEKGKMTQEEGKQFVDDMVKKSEDVKNEIEKKVQDAVAGQLQKMNVASRDDVDELRAKIEELTSVVEKMQAES
jgi:polyhydroxyalkanoate synthesis regulator phasin